MAQQTPSTRGTSTQGSADSVRHAGQAGRASEATIERDETYGLISVIYHALQGAETCQIYANDARRAGDEELVAFFEDCRDEQNRRALFGRRLLAVELAELEDEEDDLDEDLDDAGR